MSNYRRMHQQGGIYFFTFNLLERKKRGERGIWQRRLWEHCIRDELDYRQHMDYSHYNPVKHGYIVKPRDWPYSTFQHCVSQELYDLDWGDGLQTITGDEFD